MKTIYKTKLLAGVATLLVSLLSPLAVLVPQASAAAITWDGGGTPTVDSGTFTISYDISDAANWEGDVAPQAGDSLIFPANLADVDPGDSLSSDSSWRYIVNNDLPAGTEIAGITFTGNSGTDCSVYDDIYTIRGNQIDLSGNIVNSTTGNCAFEGSTIDLNIELLASVSIDATVGASSSSGAPTITYGTFNLSFCNVADSGRTSKNYYAFSVVLNGTGTLTLACGNNNLNPGTASSIGNVVIAENSSASLGDALWDDDGSSVTVNNGATINLFKNAQAASTFERDIVFVGSGRATSYCITNQCIGDGSVSVPDSRGYFSTSFYDSGTQKASYYETILTGSVTLSSAMTLNLGSNLKITGPVSGNFQIKILPGSRGSLIMQSSSNQSATPNGTLKPTTYTKKLGDTASNQWVFYGQEAELQPDETIDDKITVEEGGKLKGSGTVAEIEVQEGGVLAPGLSPGCIVSTGDLTLNGTFEVELAGTTACTQYDQTEVDGNVDITGATLNVSFINDYAPADNASFVIVKNDGTNPVTGTFAGLDDGATFNVGGYTLQINYDAGDGNDVVLLVTEVPAAPDTGFGSLVTSPVLTIVAASAVVLVLAGQRFAHSKTTSRRK